MSTETVDADLVHEPVAVVPVAPDLHLHYGTIIQHLGLEIANRAVSEATLQAKAALALQAYSALNVDTWVRQVTYEPSTNGGDRHQIPGPIVIPPQEHEALSRFLAAVEALR